MQRMRITLDTGEVIVGTPNFSDETIIEVRSGRLFDPASEFRTIKRDEVVSHMPLTAWQKVTR